MTVRTKRRIVFSNRSIRLEDGKGPAGQFCVFKFFETVKKRLCLVAFLHALVLDRKSIHRGDKARIESNNFFKHLRAIFRKADVNKRLGVLVQHIGIFTIAFIHFPKANKSLFVFPEVLVV
ncbi:hypothetical protein ES703_58262 [subsurface metagenome]